MKKLLLSLVMLSIASTSLGMQNEPKRPINVNGWFNYIESDDNANKLRGSWAPYLKIGAGLGCFALSALLCFKRDSLPFAGQSSVAQPINYNTGDVTAVFSPSISFGSSIQALPGTRFMSPQIAISQGAIGGLITAVPGFLLMRSGFEDLRLEKKALLKRLAEQQRQAAANQLQPPATFRAGE